MAGGLWGRHFDKGFYFPPLSTELEIMWVLEMRIRASSHLLWGRLLEFRRPVHVLNRVEG